MIIGRQAPATARIFDPVSILGHPQLFKIRPGLLHALLRFLQALIFSLAPLLTLRGLLFCGGADGCGTLTGRFHLFDAGRRWKIDRFTGCRIPRWCRRITHAALSID